MKTLERYRKCNAIHLANTRTAVFIPPLDLYIMYAYIFIYSMLIYYVYIRP